MNNANAEIKNTLERTNSWPTEAEEWINELKDRMVEITEAEWTVFGLNALYTSITFIWYNVLSKASVSLLILVWKIYPFDINWVIKVPYD